MQIMAADKECMLVVLVYTFQSEHVELKTAAPLFT
jgi:hypothetical protein